MHVFRYNTGNVDLHFGTTIYYTASLATVVRVVIFINCILHTTSSAFRNDLIFVKTNDKEFDFVT